MSNYPPGVTGNEPEISGEWNRPMDPRDEDVLLEDHGYPMISYRRGDGLPHYPSQSEVDDATAVAGWVMVAVVFLVGLVVGLVLGWALL